MPGPCGSCSGRLRVDRRGIDGVPPLLIAVDGPRLYLDGRAELPGCAARGVMFESVIDNLDFAIGSAGLGSAPEADLSDVGGDGGVRVSDTSEEVDFAGGVAIVGEEVDVPAECSDKADWGLVTSDI